MLSLHKRSTTNERNCQCERDCLCRQHSSSPHTPEEQKIYLFMEICWLQLPAAFQWQRASTPTNFFCGAFAERLKCIQEPKLDQKISTEDSGIWKHLNLCPFSLIEISIKCAIKLIFPHLCNTERISYHDRRNIQKSTQLPRVRRRFRLGSASLWLE